MADFKKAIAFVLKHEDATLGGKITHDSGGTTKFGISQRAYPDLDIETISLEDAEAIYHQEYWAKIRGDEIANDHLAAKLLDMAVNMGPHQAVVLCQRALNTLSCYGRLKEDGLPGAVTLHALNEASPSLLLALLRSFCAEFYRHIVNIRPEDQQYLHGWLVRANA